MSDLVLGINEDGLANLSIDILDYVDRIMELFENIDSKMDLLPNYYKGDSCTAIMNKYHELREYYEVVKKNLITYSDDMIMLVRKMQDDQNSIVKLFQQFTEETKAKTKAKAIGKE